MLSFVFCWVCACLMCFTNAALFHVFVFTCCTCLHVYLFIWCFFMVFEFSFHCLRFCNVSKWLLRVYDVYVCFVMCCGVICVFVWFLYTCYVCLRVFIMLLWRLCVFPYVVLLKCIFSVLLCFLLVFTIVKVFLLFLLVVLYLLLLQYMFSDLLHVFKLFYAF